MYVFNTSKKPSSKPATYGVFFAIIRIPLQSEFIKPLSVIVEEPEISLAFRFGQVVVLNGRLNVLLTNWLMMMFDTN